MLWPKDFSESAFDFLSQLAFFKDVIDESLSSVAHQLLTHTQDSDLEVPEGSLVPLATRALTG